SSYPAASVSKVNFHGNGQDLLNYRGYNNTPGFHWLTVPVSVSNDWFATHLSDSSLRSQARGHEADGTLSRNEMIYLFDQVGADNHVSFDEYHDLQKIASNSTFLHMPAYVANLTNKVVGYDHTDYTAATRSSPAPGQLWA